MSYLKIGQSFVAAAILLASLHAADAALIHRWSFTETAGLIQDSVGAAPGQVVVLSTPDNTRTNGHILLNGGARASADYVEMPSGLLTGLSNLTVEAWVTPMSFQIWSRLFDFGSGSGTANTFFLSLCRNASLNQQRLEFLPNTFDSGITTSTGQQYHYVITWSATGGSGGAGRMQWYRNGALIGGVDTGSATVADVDDTVLWLGRSQYNDNTANAEFDEFRLYDHILSQAQINTNFSNGPNSVVILPPIATNDAITLNPGAMALINVLQNDQAVGAPLDPNTVTIVNPPTSGTAQVKPGGKILYTHNGGVSLTDQFNYRVRDTAGGTSQVASVFITISSLLRLPNTTLTIPNSPPPVGYQIVDAFPGLVFEDVVALRSPPGSTNQLFVVERRGMISFIPDITAATPVRQVFLDIRDQVQYDNTVEGESGLLSMAFHPGFGSNGLFFVDYVAPITKYPATGWATNSYDRISRFTAVPATLTVNTNTQQILISVKDDGDTCNCVNNHNGGDLHFGPDGYLYVSMGDEGSQYNARQNSQRIDKDFYSGILRLDVDKKPGSIEPKPHAAVPVNGLGQAFYSIPPSNAFIGATNLNGQAINTNTLRAEFFAIGFRHVWRFSIDTNGEVWAGDVGQDRYEEVDLVTNGCNYGWAYYESTNLAAVSYPGQPTLLTNPPGTTKFTFPLYQYIHTGVAGGDPQYKGNSISGGVVYHGSLIPELTGSYIFGDFESANIWSLRRTNGSVVVQRIAGDSGDSAFGIDPNNGDVLIANYLESKVKRLVKVDTANSGFPTQLSDTGIFADLATLTPNPGIVTYDPIVAFWSDYAIKRRWFTIPDLIGKVGFGADTNWSLPTGMKWIKHFDLELERGNPATKKRIETRVLVKTDTGTYGVSYKWNDAQTEATLVGDGGASFFLTVLDGTNSIQQQWEIPSRAACLACHTPVAGHALSFNTRELNQVANMNGVVGNQLTTLSDAGYFTAPVANPHLLPAFARATDASASLEYRVRSYFAVNCVQCHQAGGAGPASWDARAWLTMAQTRLLNGTPENNGGDAANKLIVSGDTNHSVVLRRIQGNGFNRMPPLATHQLDQASINLLATWIGGELTNRQDFAQWQIANFGATNNPLGAANADPDADGANNYYEFLTYSPPNSNNPPWAITIEQSPGSVDVGYLRLANRGFLVEYSSNLFSFAPWTVLDNQVFFGASNEWTTVSGPFLPGVTNQYFRVKIFEP